ncbi:hypothetical protein [Bradyrhizobium sp. SRS-191]|uniref:hypothetical protein n=1 Tax=Bradyrhizobium sp. SRS-191 TaxID=2962606 RepID=UPI00211EF0DD|nr:hypothetical protein [Bradyrhizobium sp. SRS-191]
MIAEVPKRPKADPAESDFSQVMAHGPALCAAYGPRLGAMIMVLAIAKSRRGSLGVVTTIGIFCTTLYQLFGK